MKVWFYYLKLPKDLRDYYPSDMVDDFTFISYSYYNKNNHIYTNDGNSIYYLYAYTNNKSLAHDFEYIHDMNIFKTIIKKMSKYEYNNIHSDVKDLELGIHDFDTNVKIVCNSIEESEILDQLPIYLNDMIIDLVKIPYDCFKCKYIKALDILLYCTHYKMIASPDENDCCMYAENFSYGLTAEGYVNSHISMLPNIMSLYTKLYKLILRKE